ncbi:MAG: protein translocase subunit SecD, partial [Oscillospiraceae bacterium]
MKRVGKPAFFVVALLIIVFAIVTFTGISFSYGDKKTTIIKGAGDIRWGIDIRGGVDVTFTPPKNVNPNDADMNAAGETMKQRLVSLNITDYEVYIDTKTDRIIVRFPWKEGETDFNPEKAIKELGDTAILSFREGNETDAEGKPTGVTQNIVLKGKNVVEANGKYGQTDNTGVNQAFVELKLDSQGTKDFAEATKRLAGKSSISIWMDEECLSAPQVNSEIPNGQAVITLGKDADLAEATALANKINAGSLDFKLETETYSTISPTLGEGAKNAMILSGLIAFIIICIFITSLYKLPGVIACIGLLGQVAGTIAATSGFLPGFNSFTLTIPGIAGIILAVGMGVDANIITSERIKEEINNGKSVDGAISVGFKRAFSAIFDGNVTMIIISIILMGAFGSPDSFFAKLLTPLFFKFPAATQGAIYSFGYTLTVGVILNFV